MNGMTWRQRVWLKAKQSYGGTLRDYIKRAFPQWQRLGLHLTLNHYYEPVPDTRKLKTELWSRESELVGLRMREEEQLLLLDQFKTQFKDEYDNLPAEKSSIPYAFFLDNPGFSRIDAEILYCMIRHLKPRRVVEVGAGNSTYLIAQTLLKNQQEVPGSHCEFITIDPYPNEVIRTGFPGLTRTIECPIQEIPLKTFEQLGANDIFFIDSSHMLKIGSDVQYEYLEIIPRLKPGVIVHIHDVHFPSEYPKDVVLGSHRFWNEQYLVQAFLAFNESFEILWAGCFMHFRHPEALAAVFASYDPAGRWPSSLWIRRVK